MAKDDTMVMELRLRLNKAERELSKFVRKAERTQINLKGIDHKKFTQPLGKITGSVSEFQKSLEASNARVIAFSASAGILMGVTKAFQEMARATVEVEKTLKDINVIMGASSRNLQKFGAELFTIANQTGQSFFEVGKAATEFARQGLSMEKTLTRTRDALILTRLSGMDAADSVNALTAAINSFSSSALTSTQIINRLANVDAAFAVSTNDLAEAIRRVGSSADSVNVSFNEMVAIVTSVQQTTARGGNVIGNSLKTIFTRIQRTEVINQLKTLGVTVRDMQGNMKPAMQVLSEFAKVYDTLNPTLKASTAELIGGVYQMNILKAILKDLKSGYSTYSNALDVANKSTDEAIKRNQELNKTLSALINESLQNLTGLGAEIGKVTLEPLFRRVLEGFNALKKEVTIFGDISEFLGFNEKDGLKFGGDLAGNILKSFGNILSGPGFVALGTIIGKLFLDFVRFLGKSVQDFANLNKNAQKQAALQEQIKSALQANPALIDSIVRKEQTREQVERKILDALRQEIILRERIEKLSQGAGGRAQAAGFNANINKSSGQTTLTYKGKAAGHVPNFSNMQEYLGAISGGYRPGDVKQMNISGLGKVTYNSAEQVKKFPGMRQEAIMPPEESKAGRSYARRFEQKHGFDPYASKGFVPNLLNVLTSMRTVFDKKGKGSTGRMGDMLSASKEQLMKSQGVPGWLQGVLGSALRPGENVRIKTMGQLSPITESERAKFGGAGRGRAAHLKGSQMESVVAGRPGNFSFASRFSRAGGSGQLGKMPVDLGTTSKTGRPYPVESKPELKTKQIGQIFLKTLYESNSSSLKQLRQRLKTKADAGDTVAGAQLDKLQSVISKGISARGTELSKYTAGEVNSLSDFNASIGFDSRNAVAALRERKAGVSSFAGGFIPNFARARNVSDKVAMLVPEGVAEGQVTTPSYKTPKGTSVAYKFNSYDPDIPDGQKKNLSKLVEKDIKKIADNYAKRFMNNPLNEKPDTSKYFNQGALKAATGAIFEASLDAAFQRSTDKQTATWDVRKGSSKAGDVMSLFGVPNAGAMHGDYKNSLSAGNLKSMAKKIWKTQGEEGWYKRDTNRVKPGRSGGHVPNFSPIADAFKTEAAMGGDPTLDYHPAVGFYVRDKDTQKGIGDVRRDHPEGLGRASKNSKKMQDMLASQGHVPNYQGTSGFDMTVITGSLGMLAFGAIDAKNGLNSLKEEANNLQNELDDAIKKEKELGAEKERMVEKQKTAEERASKKGKDFQQAKDSEPEARKKAQKQARKEALAEINEDRKEKGKSKLTMGEVERGKGRGMNKVNEKFQKEAAAKQQRLNAEIDKEIATKRKAAGVAKDNLEKTKASSRANQESAKAVRQQAAAARRNAQHFNQNRAMGGVQVAGGGAVQGSRGRNMQRLAMPGMMMAPMIGGLGRQLAGDNASAQGAVQGLETAGTFAAMGAMAGPQGAAAGAAIGAVVGGMQALGAMKDPMKELEKNLENATEKLTNFTNSSSTYLTALDSLESAMRSEDIKPDEFRKREDALNEAMSQLPDDAKKAMAAAGGDAEKIKKIFSDIAKDLQQQQRIAEREKGFETEMDEERGWFVDWVRQNSVTGRFFDQKADRAFGEDEAGQKRLNSFVNAVDREFDTKSMNTKTGKAAVAGIHQLVKTLGNEMDPGELKKFTTHLKELGVPDEYIAQMTRVNENQLDGADAAKKLAEKLKLSEDAMKSNARLADHTRKVKIVADQHRKVMMKLREAHELTSATMKQNLATEKERIKVMHTLQGMQEDFIVDIVKARAKGLAGMAGNFQGKVEKVDTKFNLQAADAAAKNVKATKTAIQKGMQDAFSIVSEQFDKVNSQLANALGTSRDTAQEQKILEKIEKNQKIQAELAPLVEKHLNELRNDPTALLDTSKFAAELEAAYKTAGIENAELSAQLVGSRLESVNMRVVGELAILANKADQQRILLEQQRDLQKRNVELQEQIAAFGGPSGFLSAENNPLLGFSNTIDKFDKIMDSFSAANYSSGVLGTGVRGEQNSVSFGRSALGVADYMSNFAGMRRPGGKRMSDEIMPFARAGVAGRRDDIVSQLNYMQGQIELFTNGGNKALRDRFDDARAGAGEQAIDQIASQLKIESMPEDIAAMRRSITDLNEIIRSQGNDLFQNNKMAMFEALDLAGLTEKKIVGGIDESNRNTSHAVITEAHKDSGKVAQQVSQNIKAGATAGVQATENLGDITHTGFAAGNKVNYEVSASLGQATTEGTGAINSTNIKGFGLLATGIKNMLNVQRGVKQQNLDKEIKDSILSPEGKRKFGGGSKLDINASTGNITGSIAGMDVSDIFVKQKDALPKYSENFLENIRSQGTSNITASGGITTTLLPEGFGDKKTQDRLRAELDGIKAARANAILDAKIRLGAGTGTVMPETMKLAQDAKGKFKTDAEVEKALESDTAKKELATAQSEFLKLAEQEAMGTIKSAGKARMEVLKNAVNQMDKIRTTLSKDAVAKPQGVSFMQLNAAEQNEILSGAAGGFRGIMAGTGSGGVRSALSGNFSKYQDDMKKLRAGDNSTKFSLRAGLSDKAKKRGLTGDMKFEDWLRMRGGLNYSSSVGPGGEGGFNLKRKFYTPYEGGTDALGISSNAGVSKAQVDQNKMNQQLLAYQTYMGIQDRAQLPSKGRHMPSPMWATLQDRNPANIQKLRFRRDTVRQDPLTTYGGASLEGARQNLVAAATIRRAGQFRGGYTAGATDASGATVRGGQFGAGFEDYVNNQTRSYQDLTPDQRESLLKQGVLTSSEKFFGDWSSAWDQSTNMDEDQKAAAQKALFGRALNQQLKAQQYGVDRNLTMGTNYRANIARAGKAENLSLGTGILKLGTTDFRSKVRGGPEGFNLGEYSGDIYTKDRKNVDPKKLQANVDAMQAIMDVDVDTMASQLSVSTDEAKSLQAEAKKFQEVNKYLQTATKESQELGRVREEFRKALELDGELQVDFDALRLSTLQKAFQGEKNVLVGIQEKIKDYQYLRSDEALKKAMALDEKAGGTKFQDAIKNLRSSTDQRELTALRRSETLQKLKLGKAGGYTIEDSFTDMANSWKYSSEQMQEDGDAALMSVGQTFKSEATSAFKALIDGTKSSKEAFGDLFNSIGNMAQEKIIEMAVNRYVFNPIGNMFGGNSGGVVSNDGIKRFSAGGQVTGGSGVRDDVPALLAKGEYVIKKSSVNKYGMSFLNSLNSGEVPPSNSPDPQANLNSLVSSVQSNRGAYAKFNLRNAFVYDSDKPGSGSRYAIDSRLSRQALTDSDNPRNEIRMNKVANLYDYWAQRREEIDSWKKAVDEWRTQKRKKMQNSLWMAGGMAVAGSLFGGGYGSTFGSENNLWSKGKSSFNNWRQERRFANDPMNAWDSDAQGGYKKDTVPSMLMGGEYVINAKAVKQHGVDFFHALNGGRLRKMAAGGYVGSESMPEVSASTTGESGGMNNNITINVSIDQNGDVASDSNMGPERAQQLATIIENQITTTLVKEKRQGGILYKN